MNTIKTPCIGICSTTSFGDKICRGCKRFNYEVLYWNTYSEEEKRAVMSRIDQLTAQIMSGKFVIQDVARLQQALDDFRFFYDPLMSPWLWLHNLLQKRWHRITSLEDIGVGLHPSCRGLDAQTVMHEVNEELHRLSQAHFERYIQRGAL